MTETMTSGILIYDVDGAIYAAADLCIQGEASLAEENILTGKIVECPWHTGTFDVSTGKSTGMPCTIALETFPVKVIEESVYVEY